MAAGKRLDAVEPALLAALRGIAIGADDPGDVVLVHLLGERAMGRLADHRRADRRQPIVGIGVPAAAEMGDLAHDRRAVTVDALGELLEIRDDRVGADVELAEDVWTVRRDVR